MTSEIRSLHRTGSLRGAMKPVIESLESRTLLSASLDNGLLTITGTEAADTVTIRNAKFDDTLKVSINKQASYFTKSAVTGIVVNALGGDDRIDVVRAGPGGGVAIVVTVLGADGNDAIGGGARDDSLVGGNRNDMLVGSKGKDTMHGGDGSDPLLGGEG